MTTTSVDGFVASTDGFAASGSVRLTDGTIRSFMDDIRRNGLGVTPTCAEAVDLPVRVLDAAIRETPAGGLGIWVSVEVPAERWARIRDMRIFGFLITSDVRRPATTSSKPTGLVYADPQHFAGRLLPEAFERLDSRLNAGGGPLYQCSHPSLPRVLVILHAPGAPPSVEPLMDDVTSAAELFLRPVPAEATHFVVVVVRPDGRRQKAIVRARRRESLEQALATVPSRMTAEDRQVFFFDEDTGWLNG
jgi:hypothetical protein